MLFCTQNEISFAMSVTVLKLKIGYQERETTSFQACERPQQNMGHLIRMMKIKTLYVLQSERSDNEWV